MLIGREERTKMRLTPLGSRLDAANLVEIEGRNRFCRRSLLRLYVAIDQLETSHRSELANRGKTLAPSWYVLRSAASVAARGSN